MKEKIILPNDFSPRGKIKIELFDELTGKKLNEIKTHNFIAKGVKEHLFKMAMKSLFVQGKYTGGRKIYDDIRDPFQYMLLTDASHPEDPDNEWLVKGRKIGYAYTDKTYSGSDELQGTYNANESFTNINKVHIVVDFPTHAANGTFQSIYFTYNGAVFHDDYYDYLFNRLGEFNDNLNAAKEYNGYLYALKNGRIFMKFDASDYSLLEEIELPHNYNYDFDIVNEYIYFARFYSPNIWRSPLNEPTDSEEIVENVGGYAGGIVHISTVNQFVVTKTTDGYLYVLRYDNNFNLLSDTKTNYERKSNYIPVTFYNGDILIGNLVLHKNDDSYCTWTGTGEYVRGMIGNEFVQKDGYLLPKIGFSSRALLDSPVTKTSTNTMKITYDFILE